MGKTKEITEEQKALDAEKAFRESPLGQNITKLEGHVSDHLTDMFIALGINTEDVNMVDVMTNFIAASHAAGTIQRLVWEQLDYEAKLREEQPWEIDAKGYYTSIADILRGYLSVQTGLPLSEQTTSESLATLRTQWTSEDVERFEFIMSARTL